MIDIEKIRKEKPIKDLLQFSIINIDKPSGPTSFGTDTIIKKSLNLSKTSHFGTLDPMVTGVLPVALGRACKLMDYFIGSDKTYVGIIRVHKEIPIEELQKQADNFTGIISQMPPVKSRVKRQERQRTIHTFKILEKKEKDFLFESKVQAGTYIRKLVHDLGEKIGGAHMLELRRTKASIFSEENSIKIYDFLALIDKYKNGDESGLRSILIPAEIISKVLPIYNINEKYLKTAYNGSPLRHEMIKETPKEELFSLFNDQKFIGIYQKSNEKTIIARPKYVLQPL